MHKIGIIGLIFFFSFCKQKEKPASVPLSKKQIEDSTSEYRKVGYYKSFKTEIEFLFSSTKDSSSISIIQRKNYEGFIVKQTLLTPEILRKIFDDYKTNYKDYREGWTMAGKISEAELEKHLPKPTTPENLKKFITPAIVHLQNPKEAVEGTIGIEFDCTWDIENGLGVLIKDWKVVEVGTAQLIYFQ